MWLQRTVLLISMVFFLQPLCSASEQTPWQEVAGELMSPACPGRTLINCTSAHADQWRELVRQKLAEGETKEQIIQHFVDISGEAILASPPKRGFTLTVWLLPLFFIINGAGLIIVLTLRWAHKQAANGHSAIVDVTSSLPSDTTDDPYLHRVRNELARFDD